MPAGPADLNTNSPACCPDAVERVGVIHSVGIAVLEPEDNAYVLLTATFDGAWESYVRIIWQKVSRLLDLVFCNTEDYVLGYENSYEQWGAWLKTLAERSLFSLRHARPDGGRYPLPSHAGTGIPPRSRQCRRADASRGSEFRRLRRSRGSPFSAEAALIGTDPTNAGFGEPLTKQFAGHSTVPSGR